MSHGIRQKNSMSPTTWTKLAKYATNILSESAWQMGSNWSQNGGTFTHTPGSTDTIFQDLTFDITKTYYFSATLTGTVGTITPVIGGQIFSDIQAGTTVTLSDVVFDVVSSITLNPSSNFDGAISGMLLAPGVPTSWTNISAPSGTSSVTTGFAYGLLMAITRPETINSDNWTRIGAPSTTWTTIPKAT